LDFGIAIEIDPPTAIVGRACLLAARPPASGDVEERWYIGEVYSATAVARAAVLERRRGEQRVVEVELVRSVRTGRAVIEIEPTTVIHTARYRAPHNATFREIRGGGDLVSIKGASIVVGAALAES
jgi:hypothetical protein